MLSKYIGYNYHQKWKSRPSFRYTKCSRKLPFLCEKEIKKDCVMECPPCSAPAEVELDTSADKDYPSSLKFNLGSVVLTYFK